MLVAAPSIFEAYSTARDHLKIKPKDTVVLCHDDIEVLINNSDFNEIIDKNLQKPQIGFVGVAGTSHLGDSCVWWEGVGFGNPALKGVVYHGSLESGHCNNYGDPGRVVVLDGLFLATKGRILNSIQLKQPQYFPGPWDFYDLFYTMQAYVKGYHNMVLPIPVRHDSYGDLAGKVGWNENKKAFRMMFDRHIPAVV